MKKKKILIIGGTGFLGFHFAKYCLKKKIDVTSFSRKKPKKNRYLKKVNYLYGDISREKIVYKKLNSISKNMYVVNFGGEVDHGRIKETFRSHYIGVKNLSNFFIDKKLKKFLKIGRSLEYGKIKSPQKENMLVKPDSNYAIAKNNATNYLLKLHKNTKFPVVIVRPYQVYGPYQDLNRLIPFVIHNCLKNNKFPCSDGKQYRDFLFVEDFSKIVFKLLFNKRCAGEIFNVGYGKAYNVKRVINLIQKLVNRGSPQFGKINLRKEENLYTFPSIKKIQKFISLPKNKKLKDGLIKTIKFYRGGN